MANILRWLVALTVTAVIVVSLAGAWLAWRLRLGALPVPALDPYVAQAFAGRDPDLDVAFSGTVLVWPPESRLPEVRVLGLRLTRKDGRALAEFPELSFRPSARALLRGRLAVGAVGLTGVRLSLTRDAEGRLSLAGLKPAEADPAAPSPFAWLVDTSDPDAANAYLRRISIRNAEIALDDRLSTSKWRVTGANLDLLRRADRIEADLRAELVVHLETAVVRLPLEADVTATLGEAATLASVEFEAAGLRGRFDRGIEGRPPLPIRSVRVGGRFASDGEQFELAKLELRAGDSTIVAKGTMSLATREARFEGSVTELPAADLDLAWPFGVAPDARTWVLGNLRDGKVTKADFSLHHPGGRGRTSFRLEAAVGGMTVDYLAPLEPLRAVDGIVRLDEKKLEAAVSAGTAGALQLTRGAMTIDFVDAAVPAKVDAEVEGPTDDLLAFLDSPPLGYPSRFGLPTKGVGGRTAGHVELRFPLAGESRASALAVDARAVLHGEGAEGTLALGVASGEIHKLEVERFRSAKNDFSAAVARSGDGGYTASLTGARLDLQPMIDRWRSNDEPAPTAGRPYAIRFDLERVAGLAGVEWTGVRGELASDGTRVQRLDASGALANGGAVTKASIEAIAAGRRRLRATSDDAGRVLQAFGLIESARGGRLELHGVTDDRGTEATTTGRLEASEVRIEKAPLLARILSLASFEGIADAFRNEGIPFRRVRVPFTWTKGKVVLADGRAIGAIGLTADGTIDFDTGQLDIRGEVIPAYTLNTALGRVPLIGEYLTGKGGGLFGISYRVKGTRQTPDVAVNPLTALAPGKLREMFLTPFGL